MANPFLVLGGVAVGIITAGIGVLAVPGWINSANDSAAMNDLGNIRAAESAAILQIGEFTDDFAVLRSGELGVKFQKSEGVTLIGLEADTNESWCAAVQSKSGKFFAASNVQAAIATGPGAESAMTTAKCAPSLVTEVLDKAADGTGPEGKIVDVGVPGPGGGTWVGGSNGEGPGGTPGGGATDPAPVFQTITWSINCPAPADVTLPLPGAFGTVTWSDGETYPIRGDIPSRSVPAGKDLKVSFTGEVMSRMMVAEGMVNGDALPCYRGLDSFGDGTGISSMRSAFMGMTNLTAVPSKIPSGMTTMMRMFEGASSFNDDLDGWDTSAVTDMSSAFNGASAFNKPLNAWDVSHVETMEQMFYEARSFNQPLDKWSTGALTTLRQTFSGASAFNGSLAGWDLSNVWTLENTFFRASSFNQPLSTWNTGSVNYMNNLFYEAAAFNQPIGTWDTRNVADFGSIFHGAASFSQDISRWATSSAGSPGGAYGSALTPSQLPPSWR